MTGATKDGAPSENSPRVRSIAFVALQRCLACYSEPATPRPVPPPTPPEVPNPPETPKVETPASPPAIGNAKPEATPAPPETLRMPPAPRVSDAKTAQDGDTVRLMAYYDKLDREKPSAEVLNDARDALRKTSPWMRQGGGGVVVTGNRSVYHALADAIRTTKPAPQPQQPPTPAPMTGPVEMTMPAQTTYYPPVLPNLPAPATSNPPAPVTFDQPAPATYTPPPVNTNPIPASYTPPPVNTNPIPASYTPAAPPVSLATPPLPSRSLESSSLEPPLANSPAEAFDGVPDAPRRPRRLLDALRRLGHPTPELPPDTNPPADPINNVLPPNATSALPPYTPPVSAAAIDAPAVSPSSLESSGDPALEQDQPPPSRGLFSIIAQKLKRAE